MDAGITDPVDPAGAVVADQRRHLQPQVECVGQETIWNAQVDPVHAKDARGLCGLLRSNPLGAELGRFPAGTSIRFSISSRTEITENW